MFTLQHPVGQSTDVLERCWLMLYRIWIAGDNPQSVANAVRRANEDGPMYINAPPLPYDTGSPRNFPMTIADLRAFDANEYPHLLESWCRTTLDTLLARTAP